MKPGRVNRAVSLVRIAGKQPVHTERGTFRSCVMQTAIPKDGRCCFCSNRGNEDQRYGDQPLMGYASDTPASTKNPARECAETRRSGTATAGSSSEVSGTCGTVASGRASIFRESGAI